MYVAQKWWGIMADSIEKFNQKASEYDFIRFTVCDIFGRSRCKIVPARNAAKMAKNGTEIWIGKLYLYL